jgi:hypothetical protein
MRALGELYQSIIHINILRDANPLKATSPSSSSAEMKFSNNKTSPFQKQQPTLPLRHTI